MTICPLLAIGNGNRVCADDISPEDRRFFEQKIEPIFRRHCLKCHSRAAGKTEGGLRLDCEPGWSAGGDRGPVIVPGSPDESLLMQAVSYTENDLQMPPEEKLSDDEIALLREWIELGAPDPRQSEPTLPADGRSGQLKIRSLASISGSKQWDWWQARTACLPGEGGFYLTTMSRTGRTKSHDFHDVYQSVSRDEGRTWSRPERVPELRRRTRPDGTDVVPGDLWPSFHTLTGKVLVTGKTFHFVDGQHEDPRQDHVAYCVFDPKTGTWSDLQFLELPKLSPAGHPIIAPNAGCTQRVDLANGDVLLPIRFLTDRETRRYTSAVAMCSFDGRTLKLRQLGNELTSDKNRGLYEPSLVQFRGRYLLTLRADQSAFVTTSTDGLTFGAVKEWTFDDGTPLGCANTQQHWVTMGERLFLVYTRATENNRHIFRQRAPLFIAQVNPDSLQVLRATEQVLMAENGATLGNSGVCSISSRRALVTCGEGLLRLGPRRNEANRVLFVEVLAP